ncbi:MAG: oligosaccharide flippase family protein [Cytophagales bacterium]|jgi:O-antigen/teichoic acid export membrane protein|nr:oligosaccharide flippase family protein [Cytophagales bacterium]
MIYTVAGALPMASAILLMPFYGKLPADVYGSLSIYFGFSLLVQILVTYSFDASIYLNFHEHKHDTKSLAVFVSSAFVFILMLSAAVGLLLALLGNFIFDRVYGVGQIPFLPFGVLSVATGIFQALFKVNNSLLQTQGKATTFLWLNLLSFSLIAGLTILGLIVFPNTLWGPIAGKLIGALIAASWVLGSIFRQFGFHFSWQSLKPTFEFNNSSLIYQIQQWFINYYDRIIILALISKSTVGYYDVALKFLLAIDFLLTGLNATIHPKVLGKVYEQSEKASTVEINRYYNGLTGVAILAVAGSIFVFPPVIQLFFDEAYHAAIPLIPFAALVYLLRPLRLWVAMPYAALKYSKPLPYFYLVVALIKIGLLYWFVQRWGVWGAIVSTLVSYSIEIIVLFLGVRKRFNFQMNTLKLLLAPVVVGVVVLVCEPLLGARYPWVVHGFYLLVSVTTLAWAYRNELKVIGFSPFKLVK